MIEERKKYVIIRVIFLLISISVAITIFVFSSQDGDKSKHVSESLVKKVVDILPNTKGLSEKEKQRIVKKSQKPIRKLAHFSIYTILGVSIMVFFKTFSILKKKQLLFAIGICFIYAALDEIHQIFTDDRTPLITDVVIDVLGAILGASIVSFLSYLKNTAKR